MEKKVMQIDWHKEKAIFIYDLKTNFNQDLNLIEIFNKKVSKYLKENDNNIEYWKNEYGIFRLQIILNNNEYEYFDNQIEFFNWF